MSDDTQIAVVKATPAAPFNMKMFDKVKGLAENSPLRRIQGGGDLRLTVDGNQFQIKKGASVLQRIMDGKRPSKELDVVIHAISPVIQQQYIEPYDPKNPRFVPGGCWSNDGRKPDDNVWNKQSASCDTCKRGGNGDRSCGLTRLAVVSIYSPLSPPSEPMLMNFNWTSNSTKKPGPDPEENTYCLIDYLKMLASNEVETFRVITRLIVDDWSDPKNNCKLMFSPIDVLAEDSPNLIAHERWIEEGKELQEMTLIEQRKPADAADDLPSSTGAPAKKPVAPAARVIDEDDLDDEEEEEEAPKKKAEAKKKPAPAPEPEDEDEDELDLGDLGDLDDEEEEEEAPKKKAASKKKKKPAPAPEPEDEDEDEVEEDDDDFGDLEGLLDDGD